MAILIEPQLCNFLLGGAAGDIIARDMVGSRR